MVRSENSSKKNFGYSKSSTSYDRYRERTNDYYSKNIINPPPPKQITSPPPKQITSNSSNGGLFSSALSGFGFGIGSGIGRRVGDGIFGSSSNEEFKNKSDELYNEKFISKPECKELQKEFLKCIKENQEKNYDCKTNYFLFKDCEINN